MDRQMRRMHYQSLALVATHLFPNVDHFAIRHVFVEHFVQGLIAILVMLDSLPEILFSLRRFLTIVIWIA